MSSHSDLEAIRLIAQRTRRWAVRNRHRFSQDDWQFETDLNGMCAIASAKLFSNLVRAGIHCRLALRSEINEGHCFVLTDSHIVDITATQFPRNRAVMVVPIQPHHKRPLYWRETMILDSVNELIRTQDSLGWWPVQIPPQNI